MKDNLTEELSASARKQAKIREKPSEGLIHHSDYGRQRASMDTRHFLSNTGSHFACAEAAHFMIMPIESHSSPCGNEI